jgi:hypothetical protein
MVSDAFQDAPQIGLWIETVELGGGDQGCDGGGTVPARVRPGDSQFFRPKVGGQIARSTLLLSGMCGAASPTGANVG